MKVYLDDIRDPSWQSWIPKDEESDWTVVRTVKEFNKLLLSMKVKEVSLDHDLGCIPGTVIEEPNGYDAICEIERLVSIGAIPCPIIHVHTTNPSAYTKMNLAREAIYRIWEEGLDDSNMEIKGMAKEARRESKG